MSDIKKSEAGPLASSESAELSEIRDIGAGLYAEANQLSAEELEQEKEKVRKILDWRIMPMVFYQCRISTLHLDDSCRADNSGVCHLCHSISRYPPRIPAFSLQRL